MTRSFRDVFEATVAENVALIKSIPRRYLPQVEGDVMRSIAAGRDLAALSKTLQRNYASTKNRAALISLDQNNKATAAVTRTRRIDLGLYDAVWMHSHAGKEPRPTHVAMDNRKFDIRKGMYDPDANGKGKGEWVQPGYLISCRCVSRPIVKGFG
jgi:uncharacterized protein with gpF-like domain